MLSAVPFFASPTAPLPLRPESGGKVDDAAVRRAADTAKELEATFLSLLLKEMRQTLEAEGGLFPGDTGDVQGGLFDLYLGKHMADAGGVGLAASLDRQLRTTYGTGTGTAPTPAPVGGSVAGPARG